MTNLINMNLDLLLKLISSRQYSFDDNLYSLLPTSQGIYRIFENGTEWNSTLRAGRTKTAQGGLRQRIYQSHYEGNQNGNIRQQLVNIERCPDLTEAKRFLKERCKVQILVIENYEERKWVEYFMLSILQPGLCD